MHGSAKPRLNTRYPLQTFSCAARSVKIFLFTRLVLSTSPIDKRTEIRVSKMRVIQGPLKYERWEDLIRWILKWRRRHLAREIIHRREKRKKNERDAQLNASAAEVLVMRSGISR